LNLGSKLNIFSVQNETAKLSLFQCSVSGDRSNFIYISQGGEVSLNLVSFIDYTYSSNYSVVQIGSESYHNSVLFRSCNFTNHLHEACPLMLSCSNISSSDGKVFFSLFVLIILLIEFVKWCLLL
jgi:hypothetical protein